MSRIRQFFSKDKSDVQHPPSQITRKITQGSREINPNMPSPLGRVTSSLAAETIESDEPEVASSPHAPATSPPIPENSIATPKTDISQWESISKQDRFPDDPKDISSIIELEAKIENIVDSTPEGYPHPFLEANKNLFQIDSMIESNKQQVVELKTQINPTMKNGKTLFETLESRGLISTNERLILQLSLNRLVQTNESIMKNVPSPGNMERPNLIDSYSGLLNTMSPKNIYQQMVALKKWKELAPKLEQDLDRLKTRDPAFQDLRSVEDITKELDDRIGMTIENLNKMAAVLNKGETIPIADAITTRAKAYQDLLRWSAE
jgi:hypothetical protein